MANLNTYLFFMPYVWLFFWILLIPGTSSVNGIESSSSNAGEWYSGSITPYAAVANYDTSEPVFPGYTVEKMWVIFRHGERLPGTSTINEMKTILPKYQSIIKKKGKNNQCWSKKLDKWKVSKELSKSEEKDLASVGKQTMTSLGQRYRKRFSSFFPKKWDRSKYKVRATDSQRTITSAVKFMEGLFNTKIGSDRSWLTTVDKSDIVLKFDSKCLAWKFGVKLGDTNMAIKSSYNRGNTLTDALINLKGMCSLQDDDSLTIDTMVLFYEACSFESAWNGSNNYSPWCNFLTPATQKKLQYKEDLELYYDNGYANSLTGKIPCPLFKNMYQFLIGEDDPAALVSFNFTHISVIVKFMTHLGLFNDDIYLNADNFDEVDNYYDQRQWVASKIAPFALNLAFVMYRGTDDDMAIVLMVNERPFHMSHCSNVLCPLEQFTNAFYTSIHNCSYEEWASWCQNDDSVLKNRLRQYKLMKSERKPLEDDD